MCIRDSVYFGPGKGAAYCDEYVCLFVCLSTRISQKLQGGLYQLFMIIIIAHICIAPYGHNFRGANTCVLTVDMAQLSYDDTMIHYLLPLLWLTSCFHKYKMTYYVNS